MNMQAMEAVNEVREAGWKDASQKFEATARSVRDAELAQNLHEVRAVARNEVRSEENEHIRITRLGARQHEEAEGRAAQAAALHSYQHAEEAILRERMRSQEVHEHAVRQQQVWRDEARA